MPVIRPSRRSHPRPCGWKDRIRREAVVGRFVKVARKSKLPENDGTYVEGEGNRIALFNLGGEIYALDNDCTHVGGPLSQGRVEETRSSAPGTAPASTSGRGRSKCFPP